MIISQPKDKTLTKERIEAILILANHIRWAMVGIAIEAHADWDTELLEGLNRMQNLKGRFALSEKSEIVFVAH